MDQLKYFDLETLLDAEIATETKLVLLSRVVMKIMWLISLQTQDLPLDDVLEILQSDII